MDTSLMFSSETDKWATPQDFFNELDREFGFNLDVCALPGNAKTTRYYTPEQDGLTQPWEGVVWCNPPYGRQICKWVERAANPAPFPSMVVVFRGNLQKVAQLIAAQGTTEGKMEGGAEC